MSDNLNYVKLHRVRREFREKRQHTDAGNQSLIPSQEDKTVIFNIAGVQPLVPYLHGADHPGGKRLYSIQRCIRTNDIEAVGDERHLTFFEMMGNWSLGDYFKQESLTWSIYFLTEVVGLDKTKLGCSIFGGLYDENNTIVLPYDEESERILIENGIDKSRIKTIPKYHKQKSDNRRVGADYGPCGPSAEFHYDRGEEYGPNDRNIGQNDRFIEIRNNVFMSFYQDKDGEISSLQNKNIDTGMGLERLLMCIENTPTIFETDAFFPLISFLSEHLQVTYNSSQHKHPITQSYRILADHLRASCFLLMDGVIPSNESRGYVCRRLIRRAYYHLLRIQKHSPQNNTDTYAILHDLITLLITQYQQVYPNLTDKKDIILANISKEAKKFQRTIRKGYKIVQENIQDIQKNNKQKQLEGEVVFTLYDTYGFPLELTKEIAKENNIEIDIKGFHQHMEQAKERARQSATFHKDIDRAQYLQGIPQTIFLGQDAMKYEQANLLKKIETEEGSTVMVLDKTPFYAQGGGQVSDKGYLVDKDGKEWEVYSVISYNGIYLHMVREDNA